MVRQGWGLLLHLLYFHQTYSEYVYERIKIYMELVLNHSNISDIGFLFETELTSFLTNLGYVED